MPQDFVRCCKDAYPSVITHEIGGQYLTWSRFLSTQQERHIDEIIKYVEKHASENKTTWELVFRWFRKHGAKGKIGMTPYKNPF